MNKIFFKGLSLRAELHLDDVKFSERYMFAYDGDQYGSNVDNFTNRKLRAKVVDNILNAPVYFSRQLSQGQPMIGKKEDVTIDVVSNKQGHWITGLEDIKSSEVNSTIHLSLAQTAFTHQQVSISMDSFASSGVKRKLPLCTFN